MIILGFILIFMAGMSDGSMYLPAKYTKKWQWEHYWSVFSLAFFVISWILTFILVPDIFGIYWGIAAKDIIILSTFGALWGVGAILFGLACHLVGMALTFPIALGTVAAMGSLIPLMSTESDSLFTKKGILVIVGLIITVCGIVVCSRAYKIKEEIESQTQSKRSTSLIGGLLVAVFAGVFSALLNVGFSFADNVTTRAVEFGATETFASTAVWALFFSVAFVVNVGYCLFLMVKHNSLKTFWGPEIKRNFSLGVAMGALFTCAIFIYSMGATCLGSWGEVPGWVLFMSVDIITGNVWGLVTGEWDLAPKNAQKLLKLGTGVIIIAIIVVAVSPKIEALGYAYSFDGFKWFKYGKNPVAVRQANPNASAFAEVHAIIELPYIYIYHTLRPEHYEGRNYPWVIDGEDLGVQVLATQRPFGCAQDRLCSG